MFKNILNHPKIKEIKPKYYVETKFEHIDGFSYNQPIEYCNDIKNSDYSENSYERENWGKLYWESYGFNQVLDICRYKDPLWVNENKLVETIVNVYKWYNNSKENRIGSIHDLFNIEMLLIQDGAIMLGFSELNAYHPGFAIVNNKFDNIINGCYSEDEEHFIFRSRSYGYKNNIISFCFGIDDNHMFYMVINNDKEYYVPMSMEEFKDPKEIIYNNI